MATVDVLFEDHHKQTTKFARVPCVGEFISFSGQHFTVQTVMHLAGTDRAEITVNGVLDKEKLPKPFAGAIRISR